MRPFFPIDPFLEKSLAPVWVGDQAVNLVFEPQVGQEGFVSNGGFHDDENLFLGCFPSSDQLADTLGRIFDGERLFGFGVVQMYRSKLAFTTSTPMNFW